jgi:hypothetical protein
MMPISRDHRIRHCVLISFAIVAAATVRVRAGEAVLFGDEFATSASASDWVIHEQGSDYVAEFAFDYSALGIPLSPHSSGSETRGLRLLVNSTDGNPERAAVSLYPAGATFSGDHTLRFDLWLNYNGGPGGGSGSTQFATWGLAHAGDRAVWAFNPTSDGVWFAASGEGGDSIDYRAYRQGALLAVSDAVLAAVSGNAADPFFQNLFSAPPFETAGSPGKQWVAVEVSYRAGVVTWRINDRLIAIRDEPNLPTGAIMLGLMDTYTSISVPPNDTFAIFDNVRVTAPDCDDNGVADAAEIAAGSAPDCNQDGIPDGCTPWVAGDFDADGDVDLADFAEFVDCLKGPTGAVSTCAWACLAAFDTDGSQTVDLADHAAFQRALSRGPFPPRPAAAVTGSQFIAETAGLSRAARETRMQAEITSGNVPGFLRTFIPITVSRNIGGNLVTATYHVTCDYLAIGVDRDFVRVPMTPLIAQPIADAFDCVLPTRRMVNDIYAQATVKLAPAPISPSTTDITRLTTMFRHHEVVEAQRGGAPLGALVGGIKKDVVITPLLASNPGKVAIYGWHQLNGVPIQPLYLGHGDFYVDYSHGIRLVRQDMLVDGAATTVADVLAHAQWHVLLSDEGVVPNPSY